MFFSSARRLAAWWTEFSDDILGADLDPDSGAEAEPATSEPSPSAAVAYHRTHAHRQPLAGRRLHRPGQVPERPAFCLSPVRASDPVTDRRRPLAR